ncbi:MAG: hypothetical protein J7578_01965 [Chitinophagaceae bacterium]|nr:hypothetical protein [Chitinophagaceae bacterium]
MERSFHITGTTIACLLSVLMLASCKKENKIVENDDDRKMYKLPQGNQPYDQQIMEFYNKYKTVILYNFVESDFSYSFTGPMEAGLWITPAGPNGIQQTLDFLQQHWFSMYPDEFLKKNLPFKLLLASDIRKRLEWGVHDTIQLKARPGYRNVAFGLTGHLDNLSHAAIDSARGSLHGAFWLQAILSGTIEMPPGFPSLSAYPADPAAMKLAGTFSWRSPMDGMLDVGDHIEMITSHHKSWLDANLFTPANDPAGNYKKKYNIIVNFYKTKYNIDLQAIGDL